MRSLISVVTLSALCTTALAERAADPAALLSAATQKRDSAVSALADSRARIVEQRRKLFARIAQLQGQLQRERDAGMEAAERLDAATRARAKREAEVQREHDAYDRLLVQVAESCGLRGQFAEGDPRDVGGKVRGALAARLTRIQQDSRLRVRSLEIANRTGQSGTLPVISLGGVQELAAGPRDVSVGFVRRDGDTAYVNGPPLPPPHRDALQKAAGGDVGALPCDVTGSLAAQQSSDPWTLSGWLAAGGVFMWPIMMAILFAIGLAAERILALMRLQVDPLDAEKVLAEVRGGNTNAALETVAGGATPLDRVLRAGLRTLGLDRPAREAALEAALLEEQPRFEKSLSLLAALAAIAPLLGLLGTVTGMIGTFESIAVNGTGNPRLLSGGISEALITTQAGLLTAVPILLLHASLSRVVDSRQSVLEQTAASLLASGERDANATDAEASRTEDARG